MKMNHTGEQDDEEDSVEYWKSKYIDLNSQYDEYQKQSADLENELDIQLKQSEERIRELESKNSRFLIDNDTLKNKLNEVNLTTHKQISQLQDELAKSNAVREEMHKYIRELEQKNDDLERTNRCAMFSLAEFESKINEALERNAILESELDEKDELAETVQRLRDEARDLRQELAVRQNRTSAIITHHHHNTFSSPSTPVVTTQSTNINLDNCNNQNYDTSFIIAASAADASGAASSTTNDLLHSSTLSATDGTLPSPQQQQQNQANYSHFLQQQQQQIPLKPSARISALNYVGDVLRKITSLETRLLASRNLMKESNCSSNSSSTTTTTTTTTTNMNTSKDRRIEKTRKLSQSSQQGQQNEATIAATNSNE